MKLGLAAAESQIPDFRFEILLPPAPAPKL